MRLKAELSETTTSTQDQIRNLEVQHVSMNSQLIGLEQKLQVKLEELHKLKTKSVDKDNEFDAQLSQFESKIKTYKNELQKRDNQIKELMDVSEKNNNMLSKDAALLQQKCQLQ
jgi:uncharacterized protein involved in exopolysaccharide biosynthesis